MDYAFIGVFLVITVIVHYSVQSTVSRNRPTSLKEENLSTTELETSPSELEFTSFFADDNDGTDPKYPYQEIEKYLETHPKEKRFFILNGPQIGLRGGWSSYDEEESGESLCKVKRNQYYAPQILPNVKGDVKTIVNHAQYQQFIETERCVEPNVSDYKCDSIRAGYNSVCHQNYKAVKLAYFNNTMGIGFDLFKIPACCVCKLKRRL